MTHTFAQIEREIVQLRGDLNAWLRQTYGDSLTVDYSGEVDCSYPRWGAIEGLCGQIFELRLTSTLSPTAIDSVLFFISRSDEIGAILAWMRPFAGRPFSYVGDLTYEDFIFLCEQSLSRGNDACDYQLVACFRKRESLNPHDIRLLHQFFETRTCSYTRRLVVDAYSEFAVPETIPLVERLWSDDSCEFAKLSCLYALAPFHEARALFRRFLAEYERSFPAEGEEYRQAHLRRFRELLAQ